MISMLSTISNKKLLGKYYTSLDLAQAMTDWAIRDKASRVLDPAFGKAVFLKAASETIKHLGAKLPAQNLYGVEIDSNAKDYLSDLVSLGARDTNFLIADFLSTRSESLSNVLFDAVVGNPPFVRNSQISKDLKMIAQQATKEDGFEISGMSGYWAYFLLHSLSYIKAGGRLAMILPSAFISAQYSATIRKLISNHFQRASILVLNDRWFPDAQESIVILLAEHRLGTKKRFQLKSTNSEREMTLASKLNGFHICCLKKTIEHNWNLLLKRLPGEISILLRPSTKNRYLTKLRDFVTVRIGVVTGANGFFILNSSKAQELGITPPNRTPIVTRSRHLRGLDFLDDQLSNIETNTYLLVTSRDEKSLPESVRAYLKLGHQRGFDKRHNCRSRRPWHLVRRIYVPDAFLHYMSCSLPHIVLNSSSSTCTNAIHRLTWKRGLTIDEKKAVAVASTTSLAQISFEVQGRSYCGGLLKLEPTKALDVVLPKTTTSGINHVFLSVDQLLREGRKESAVTVSDEFALEGCLGLSPHFTKHLRKCWKRLVDHRKRL